MRAGHLPITASPQPGACSPLGPPSGRQNKSEEAEPLPKWQRSCVWTPNTSITYAAVFRITLFQAIQLVDKFHVVKLANSVLNTTRCRDQFLIVRIVVASAGYRP